MARWHYHYAGLTVASEVRLPEWQTFAVEQPIEQPDVSPDVEICLARAAAGASAPLLTAHEYRFHIEGIGTYWVQAGRLIQIDMHPSAGEREMRLFLLGSAWGALCYQRGLLALHASVVDVRGEAIAFCGSSGAGKSSIAAWLVAQGHRLICDDLCHFEVTGRSAHVFPAAPRLKLWRNALDDLQWKMEGLERDHFRMEKFHVHSLPELDPELDPVQVRRPGAPVPLRAIYLLKWGQAKVDRLTGLAALYGLVESATYRGELLEAMGALAAHWQRCADLARAVPIFNFTRPAVWSALPSAMHMLLEPWQP